MRRVPAFVVSIALPLTLLLACDSGRKDDQEDAGVDAGPAFDAGRDPDRNEVESDQMCERLTTIQCAAEAYCCEDPGRDFKACKKAQMEGCTMEAYFDNIAENSLTGFDATRATTAFETFEELAAECNPGIAVWARSDDGLRSMLYGTVAPKGNCAPDATSDDPLAPAFALASCKDPTKYACQPRATNDDDGNPDWTCDARSDVDGSCFTDANCQQDLYCNNQQNMVGAKCRPRKDEGRACNGVEECASFVCEDNKCVATSREKAYCLAQ